MQIGIWIVVATKGCSIITNGYNLWSGALISSCSRKETDQQSVQHEIQCIKSRFSKEVIMLLLAYHLEA